MADPKQPQNTPESPDFDLDAALEEKFRQVRDDLTHIRQLDAAEAAAHLEQRAAEAPSPSSPPPTPPTPSAPNGFHAAGDLAETTPTQTPPMPSTPVQPPDPPTPRREPVRVLEFSSLPFPDPGAVTGPLNDPAGDPPAPPNPQQPAAPDLQPAPDLQAAQTASSDQASQTPQGSQSPPQPPNTPPDLPPSRPQKPARPESSKERRARHRQRRSMLIATRIGEVLRVFTIGILLFGGSIYLLVGARPTESAEENRMLATFPAFSWSALADGSYMEDVMHYYEDTVPGRSFFKQLISSFEVYQGVPDQEGVSFIGNVSLVDQNAAAATPETTQATTAETTAASTPVVTDAAGNTMTQTTTSAVTTTTTTTAPEEEPIDVGDGIVLVGDRAISVYGGSYSIGETYANTLNAFQQELGDGVQVYSLVAPTSVSFYLPESYQNYTASEIDNIDHINEFLDGVLPVDAYHALEQHTDEAIYARTDHHWLPLGAYYAAQAFAETAGVPFAPLSDYEAVTKSGYVGSMYTFTQSQVLQDNPEDFTYYIPQNDYTTTYYDIDYTNERTGDLMIDLDNVEPVSWYLVFMGSDERITHVSTDVGNDRTLVIVKDSYGNALVPCLTQSFSEIYVIDIRYFERNAVSFMQEVGATDVLFAMNTFSATGGNCRELETIRTQ